MNFSRILGCAVLLGAASLVPGETVFPVVRNDAGSLTRIGHAVMVSPETLITHPRIVAGSRPAQVRDPATGHLISAEVRGRDEAKGLALLAVPSLPGDAITVALEESETGRQVHLLLSDGVRKEAVVQEISKGTDGRVSYRFAVVAVAEEASAPLMNNCGQLLAISEPSVADRGGTGLSGSLAELIEFLEKHEVAYERASERCLSVGERLEQAEGEKQRLEAEKTELEAERKKLEEEAEQSKEAAARSQQEARQAEERRAELEKRQRRNRAELKETQAEIERQKELQERQRKEHEDQVRARDEALEESRREREEADRIQAYVGVTLAVLLLLGGLVVGRQAHLRKQRLQESYTELEIARRDVASASASFSDVLLAGSAPSGREVRLKINGNALARSGAGQILGRSSVDADYVVTVDSVSRRHARLTVDDGKLILEDLNSFNGTLVGGERLEPGGSRVIGDGDRIVLGDVELRVHILSDSEA